jgi:sigma-B regulation protein RsbU (phosphoserine phosphatase)
VSDLEGNIGRAALVGALLENQILAGDLARANDRIDHEAREVGQLQLALLPQALPRAAGMEIVASYEPSGRAGGDLYDFFPLHEGSGRVGAGAGVARWCIFVGDTAGHGLPAAVVMAIVQAVLRARPAGAVRPATLLAHANHHLYRRGIGGFVTAFLGVYEPGRRRLVYAIAGHPPPLLRSSIDGSVRALDEVGSYPLGIDDNEAFEEAAVQFNRDDTVLLYTDGVTEARGPAGDLFGMDRLARALRVGPDRPSELIDQIRHALRSHEDGTAARDDRTLVAARVL